METAMNTTNRAAEIMALTRLDEACVQLQKQGSYLEALGISFLSLIAYVIILTTG